MQSVYVRMCGGGSLANPSPHRKLFTLRLHRYYGDARIKVCGQLAEGNDATQNGSVEAQSIDSASISTCVMPEDRGVTGVFSEGG